MRHVQLSVKPGKVVALGLNYADHAEELGMQIPDEPVIFIKPGSSVISHGEKIIYPAMSKEVHYEAELGVVIGRRAKNIAPESAGEYILGYTCVNDVTARDIQRKDGQWTRAKSFDTFCPVGPDVACDADIAAVKIEAYLNGRLVQSSSTKNMIFKIPQVVSYVSRIMTLDPYDVISTGTPPGVGPMSPGDTIEIRIENVGSLINEVALP